MDYTACKRLPERLHSDGRDGHEISSGIFTGGGGTDSDVGNGGGIGFRAYGRLPLSATRGPGHAGFSPTRGFP